MPIMDGYEVLKHYQQHTKSLPIITVTANNDSDEEIKLHRLGADAICSKPIDSKQILQALEQFLSH